MARDKLQHLEEIFNLLDKDVPSTSEVAELVATIIQVVKEAKEFLEKQAIENKKDLNSFVNRLAEQEVIKISEAIDNLKDKAEKVIKSINEKTKLDLDLITKNLYLELTKLRSLIPKKADFSEVYDKIKEVESKIVPVKDIEPAEVRDKLESLEKEERLKINAIHKLREELDELKKKIDSKIMPMGVSGSSGGGRIVKIYSLSSVLDGVTKTFALPAFWRVLNVHSTSFPNSAFEPITDYTTDGNLMKITFTSAIDASTILAAGQTLLIEYAE